MRGPLAPVSFDGGGDGSPINGLQHALWIILERVQKNTGWTLWLASALFPILKRREGNAIALL